MIKFLKSGTCCATLSLLLILSLSKTTIASEEKLSEEDKSLIFKTAENFSDCAGIEEALSIYVEEKLGDKKTAMAMHEHANGATVAGGWSLFSARIISHWQTAYKFSQEKAETTKNSWQALIESKNRDDSYHAIKEAKEKSDYCYTSLGELQNILVTQARRALYASAADKENGKP